MFLFLKTKVQEELKWCKVCKCVIEEIHYNQKHQIRWKHTSPCFCEKELKPLLSPPTPK